DTSLSSSPLALHDALPIFGAGHVLVQEGGAGEGGVEQVVAPEPPCALGERREGKPVPRRDRLVVATGLRPLRAGGEQALADAPRSEEHTSERQSRFDRVCR